MSLAAPVVGSWKTSSSATRPPSMYDSWSSISLRVVEYLSSSGSTIVYPRARPRGRIVILCTGSVLFSAAATRAWPPSWYAVIFFSFSFISRVRFCGPATTRSIASSSGDVADELGAAARGEQRGLVEDVRQVGAGEARRALGDREQVDVAGQRLALGVHREDVQAALEVGALDRDLPVEAAGPQQRGVEDVRAVRRRDEDDAALDVEAVHLDQELVQRLLALVVAAAEARRRGAGRRRRSRRRTRWRARSPWPARTGRARGRRRRRRTSRRSRSRRWSRRARRPRRPPRGPAASCRCRAGRTAGRPWGSSRRRPGTSPAPAGTP